MEFVFDLLAEFIFEIIGEGYVSLCSAFVPQKAITEKGKKIIQGICLVVSILLFVGLFFGRSQEPKFFGLAPYFFKHNLFTYRNCF